MFRIKLKSLREAKGISQKEFAANIGVAQSSVGMWESGKREPRTLDQLKRIADYFGVSTDYLLERDTEEKPTPVAEDGLDPDEVLLMNLVERLTPDQQSFLLAWLKTALSQEP